VAADNDGVDIVLLDVLDDRVGGATDDEFRLRIGVDLLAGLLQQFLPGGLCVFVPLVPVAGECGLRCSVVPRLDEIEHMQQHKIIVAVF
jgi:hypothetical protein